METRVVGYLQQWWPDAERRALHGNTDRGDVAGIPGLCAEIKACKTMGLAGWVDEAVIEAGNCGPQVMPVVIHRRVRKRDAGEQYVTMRLEDFCRLWFDNNEAEQL
jgi:hypothetical protein